MRLTLARAAAMMAMTLAIAAPLSAAEAADGYALKFDGSGTQVTYNPYSDLLVLVVTATSQSTFTWSVDRPECQIGVQATPPSMTHETRASLTCPTTFSGVATVTVHGRSIPSTSSGGMTSPVEEDSVSLAVTVDPIAPVVQEPEPARAWVRLAQVGPRVVKAKALATSTSTARLPGALVAIQMQLPSGSWDRVARGTTNSRGVLRVKVVGQSRVKVRAVLVKVPKGNKIIVDAPSSTVTLSGR